jgi:hypothetical protein
MGEGNRGHTPLVKSNGNEPSPSVLRDGGKLTDRLVVQAHGIVDSELISRRALLDVTRPVHARNVRGARKRRAVDSHRRSTVKWDGASTAALEVIPSINALVSLLSEFRAANDATGSVTLVAQNAPLPLVDVTLVWFLARAVRERPALSRAFLEGGLADAFSIVGSVTFIAGEVTRLVLGTNQGPMLRAIALLPL